MEFEKIRKKNINEIRSSRRRTGNRPSTFDDFETTKKRNWGRKTREKKMKC
ncbi:hypothetical protein WN55_04871 [Dufourea novaeangliae]|uniref:Uncharacterized protein n=1 Tax=Dufourea novaeangliae TaxID=178035 RepID=A0A154PND2_DUFNO|nr:hypothetical protein WN55_04871 [Dufourea novaeangliae]